MSSQSDSGLKAHIFQAAYQLIHTPAASFTMEELAQQTGLSRATLYRQVGSKQALLRALANTHGLELGNQWDMRSRILQAARTLFGQYGLASPTMGQIAATADVGVATVYRHFGDKPSLLKAFLETFQPQLSSTNTAASGDLTTDLRQLVQTLIQFLLQHQDMVQLSLSSRHEWQALLSEARPFQERSVNRVAKFLQRQIAAEKLRPVDPKKAAVALLGMIFSFCIIMPTYYDAPEPDPAETAVFITQLFLQGLQSAK